MEKHIQVFAEDALHLQKLQELENQPQFAASRKFSGEMNEFKLDGNPSQASYIREITEEDVLHLQRLYDQRFRLGLITQGEMLETLADYLVYPFEEKSQLYEINQARQDLLDTIERWSDDEKQLAGHVQGLINLMVRELEYE